MDQETGIRSLYDEFFRGYGAEIRLFCSASRPNSTYKQSYALSFRSRLAMLAVKGNRKLKLDFQASSKKEFADEDNMAVERVVHRDRRIPGRLVGYLFFSLRWPSGTFSQRSHHCSRLEPMIRLFRHRLRLVPPAELSEATASFDASVRKASGGFQRVTLATWIGTEPLELFFQAANATWQSIPKEEEDQGSVIPYEGSDIGPT